MTCFMCRGDMEEKLTTFMVEIDGCIIIVKGVPSHVCTQCGEVSYDTDVVVRLEKIVDNMKKSSMEIAVSSYEAA
ncbi:type II toxin-antitoxin system MqsA family antitoxin [Selenomonas sp. AE3005]|uniref:type II toxin-antitoxin system MqsA family antitoxin n=1 Tax=Selenomonas sp. AE3005 TaxID=1485543 RepID=UPI0025DBDC3E|nr:type II toxin-antitoxin system MqsA family antitoxin [Selenomonas sp. AE3005]